METRKIFYDDVRCAEFEATVISCEEMKNGYGVVLDQTAFYPEGGGQPADIGTLGEAVVTDVHEKNGLIIHTVNRELPVGACVHGTIDYAHRMDLTQQHSGEHIVSGLIHKHFGLDNVGFHMGKDFTTIDFNGELDAEQLKMIEAEANQYIWENHDVHIFWPTASELEVLPYRSKKELAGAVRIVEYPGADMCACCGTHVKNSGEVGIIKFVSWQKNRGGVRIELLCGKRAYEYLTAIQEQNRTVSNLLSAKALETADAVEKLMAVCESQKVRLAEYGKERIRRIAEERSGTGDCVLFEKDLDSNEVRELCVAVMESCGGMCAVFSGNDLDGYKYALGKLGEDIRPFAKKLNTALNGRGGGRDPFFVQGSVKATKCEIENQFNR